MTKYGYVRVSTAEQNVERQVKKMCELEIDNKNLFIDHASGKNMDRPQWRECVDKLKAGDTLYIDSLDRLGRSYELVTHEWRRITRDIGADICTLDLEIFDSAKFKAMGDIGRVVEDMLLSLLSYVAETERKKLLQRQAEGIAVAKSKGVYKGTEKMTFDIDLINLAETMLREGVPKCRVAETLGVSKQTVYNMLADGRLAV